MTVSIISANVFFVEATLSIFVLSSPWVTTTPTASVEIKDGVAHLSGTFPDQASKDAAITQLKALKGIKDVHDMAEVKAVVEEMTIETASVVDPAIEQKVKDALKDFPSVNVGVVNGELTLTGNVSQTQARKIKESVDALKVGKVNFNYTVK